MKRIPVALSVTLLGSAFLLSACGPEAGSPEWCNRMMDRKQNEWTPKESQIFGAKCQAQMMEGVNSLMKEMLGN